MSQENDYAFEEIQTNVLTHHTNHKSIFKDRFAEVALQQHG